MKRHDEQNAQQPNKKKRLVTTTTFERVQDIPSDLSTYEQPLIDGRTPIGTPLHWYEQEVQSHLSSIGETKECNSLYTMTFEELDDIDKSSLPFLIILESELSESFRVTFSPYIIYENAERPFHKDTTSTNEGRVFLDHTLIESIVHAGGLGKDIVKRLLQNEANHDLLKSDIFTLKVVFYDYDEKWLYESQASTLFGIGKGLAENGLCNILSALRNQYMKLYDDMEGDNAEILLKEIKDMYYIYLEEKQDEICIPNAACLRNTELFQELMGEYCNAIDSFIGQVLTFYRDYGSD